MANPYVKTPSGGHLAAAGGDTMAESMKETLAGGVGGGDASVNIGGGDAVPPFESNLESKF